MRGGIMVVVLVLDKEAKGSSWQCSQTVLPPEVGGSYAAYRADAEEAKGDGGTAQQAA